MSDDIRAEVERAQATSAAGAGATAGAAATKPATPRRIRLGKRTMLYMAVGVILLGVAAVAMMVLGSGPPSLAQFDGLQVNASAMAQLRSIALNMTLAHEVGTGSVYGLPYQSSSKTPLTEHGKPEVLYIGADYCPFCAVTRWGFVLALMRFGNFSTLHYMTSGAAAGESYPGSPTFTFYNSNYSSGLISFVGVEKATNNYTPLQATTVQENEVYLALDTNNPYVPAPVKNGIPFVDFGNISVQVAAPVSPAAIYQSTWGRIMSGLPNPNSAEAQAIIGTANIFTSQICAMTGGNPASVCSQPFAKRLV